MTKAFKHWSQKFVGSIRLQLAMANKVILKLDQAMDRRPLSLEELDLRKELKCKCHDLASLSRTIVFQRSRLTFLAERDANTRFFHLQACHCGRNNHIAQLSNNGSVLVEEEDKALAIFQHFDAILDSFEERSHGLDLDLLGLPQGDLSHLDHCFSMDEI
jgi:hypothetical protein